MTGRRRWSRISIRFGLISISLLAVLLAIYMHYRTASERRSDASIALSKLGVTAFSIGDEVEFQHFTVTASGEGPTKIVMPIIAQVPPSAISSFGRRVFGDQMFDDYGTLLVQGAISDQAQPFLDSLEDLPNIHSIHYYENTIDDSLLHESRTRNPRITLIPLNAVAPKDLMGNVAITP